MSTTSKRPKVAKLSFQVTPGHCCLILSATVLARALKSLGSFTASGAMRLRITNVAIGTPPFPERYNYLRGASSTISEECCWWLGDWTNNIAIHRAKQVLN